MNGPTPETPPPDMARRAPANAPTGTPSPETAPRRAPGFFSLWLPPVVYLAAIFVISSQQQPFIAPPSWIWGSDKVAHFAAYACLGVLLCRAYRGSGLAGSAAFWLALLTASLYGASDEWHQSFVPNRSADPSDWLADSIGAALGAALFLLVLRARDRRASMR